MATVKNVGGSFIDLEDGRTLEPGAIAEDVNLDHHHNQRLVTAGLLAETQDDTTSAKSETHRHRAPAHKEDK